jgi:hypothetical protein
LLGFLQLGPIVLRFLYQGFKVPVGLRFGHLENLS